MNRFVIQHNILDYKQVQETVRVLKKGGVIVLPTDTVYGMSCDIFSQESLKKLFRAKGRDKFKPMSIMCSEISDIANYALVPNFAFRLMKRCLPGPYTFILEASKKIPKHIRSNTGTIGIRIPDSPLCFSILKEMGSPLITTSVNLTGEAPLNDPDLIEDTFKHEIEILIDVGTLQTSQSTVIDLTSGFPELIRQGEGKFDL
jgi:tRNA threonylcarbamoyl adenosine modification protein (Sua5/YciO/YrdC/YwlC family)